jgi:hypothetical protein
VNGRLIAKIETGQKILNSDELEALKRKAKSG